MFSRLGRVHQACAVAEVDFAQVESGLIEIRVALLAQNRTLARSGRAREHTSQ